MGAIVLLGRAMSLLDAIAATPGLTLAQLSARTGIARSSVHRMVRDFQSQGYLVPASTSGGYRLGPRLVSIAVTSYVQVVTPLHPMLVGLSRSVNENVDLAMLERDDVMILDRITVRPRQRPATETAKPLASHASCLGKALLAKLSEDEARALVGGSLRRFTPQTIVDPDRLMGELKLIRRDGLAFDDEEYNVGVSGVAIVVRNAAGFDQAVSIVAPTERFRQRRGAYARALIRWRQTLASRGITRPHAAA